MEDRQTDRQTDRPTDRPTDQQTDIATYRAAIAAKKSMLGIKCKRRIVWLENESSPIQVDAFMCVFWSGHLK